MKQKQIKEQILIGLEIHGYLQTEQKLFCECAITHKIAKPNTNICPICTGLPGNKPMLPNQHAVKDIVAIALMLGCKINPKFLWQRKHYDWPDLPKGYQDTVSGAHAIPIGEGGSFLGIRIREVHLEEDPARWDPLTGKIDYNRSGLPLVEIVTEPDFTSSKQVREWLKQLIITLSYIKAVNRDAGLKADVNVSTGSERVEVKNVNSIRNIVKAINYEVKRQLALVRQGRKVTRETRAFIEKDNSTKAMRTKELTEDYRFIPDPDLPDVSLQKKYISGIQKKIPELPQLRVSRFSKEIREKEAKVLTRERELAEFYETVSHAFKTKQQKQLAAEWVTRELLRILNYNKKDLYDVNIQPKHFVELLKLLQQKKITPLTAKRMLNDFIPRSFSPTAILKKEDSARISDITELEKVCKTVMQKNPQAVTDYKSGRKESFNFLLGKVMAATKRRADPENVRKIMKELIKSA